VLVDLTAIDAAIILSGASFTVTGSGAEETVTGSANGDTINAGGGIDTINGGAGDDTVTAGEGADIIDLNAGADTLDLTEATAAGDDVTLNQGDGSAVDTSGGTFADFDVITGFSSGTAATNDDLDVTAAGNGTIQVVSQNNATTATNDLADGSHTDADAIRDFFNDSGMTFGAAAANDHDIVAVTFSDYTAVYLVDDADGDNVVDVGEIELLAHVDAVLVANDLI